MTELPELYDGVPYDYASVVGTGSILFTAGACPLDKDGMVVAPGDHAAQAARALANLDAVLEIHGADRSDIVRSTIYVVGDRADLVTAWKVISGGLAPHRPPSTLLGVAVLGYEHQLIEIDAIATLPKEPGCMRNTTEPGWNTITAKADERGVAPPSEF
jgi:enamine deaminase RidA (YjgF/YER057c/UK114 family)